MIEAVLVADVRSMAAGIQRLLESEGDIGVTAVYSSVGAVLAADPAPDAAVLVIGPDVKLASGEWSGLAAAVDAGRVLLLSPSPGWRKAPAEVVEVPMELSGRSLRLAVRQALRNLQPVTAS